MRVCRLLWNTLAKLLTSGTSRSTTYSELSVYEHMLLNKTHATSELSIQFYIQAQVKSRLFEKHPIL